MSRDSCFQPRKNNTDSEMSVGMRECKATVTHLIPATGQILVGGAVAEFSSLLSRVSNLSELFPSSYTNRSYKTVLRS